MRLTFARISSNVRNLLVLKVKSQNLLYDFREERKIRGIVDDNISKILPIRLSRRKQNNNFARKIFVNIITYLLLI